MNALFVIWGLTVMPRLALNSWVQVILLTQTSEYGN